jgi:nicotinamidase/pyrazinamidase
VQNDFCPGGALAVAGGDAVVPVLNRRIRDFTRSGLPVFTTRDWHPERTAHFNTQGGPWPPHCIQGTYGAAFHPDLAIEGVTVVSKGMDPEGESYSAFHGVDEHGVALAELLHARGVHRLFIGGLATDYCVKHTVLDALRHGFQVVILADAIRGVDLRPGDSEGALNEMLRAGASVEGEPGTAAR